MQQSNLLKILILLLATACSNAPERVPAGKGASGNGTGDSTNGTGDTDTKKEPPAVDPSLVPALKLSLAEDGSHDALNFTYGAAKLDLESSLKNAKLKVTRSYLVKKGVSLSSEQKALAARFCKDIGISSSTESFEAVANLGQDDLYLIWRSHFAPDLKLFLLDYLTKNNENLRCALSLTLEEGNKKEGATILFDAMSEKADDLIGSAKMEEALKEGVLLASSVLPKELKAYSLEPIGDAAKIQLKIPAVNQSDLKLEAIKDAPLEQCYLVSASGTSKPYNPKSISGSSYNLATSSDVDIGDIKTASVDGRMIKECAAAKINKTEAKIDITFSCADYFAIKDQGLEAGCAWELPVVNKRDAENSLALPVNMEKLAVKVRDGASILAQSVDSLVPISGINDIRDGKTDVKALSKGQGALLEDALDLWIAIDEVSYRKYFYNHLKLYKTEQCSYDAHAQFNSQAITWCNGASIAESTVSKRFTDPYEILYRAMVTWHETMHTHGFAHDKDDSSYAPCAGSAASAHLFVSVVKNCSLDICKGMKSGVAGGYRYEMEYNFGSDPRRKQGDCKAWADELGITIQ